MARKKSSAPKVSPQVASDMPYHLENDARWGGFINIRLDDEQKAEFYAWYADGAPHVDQQFDDMLAMGLKFSLAYDGENECFICSITGALVGSDREARYTSTSRAGTRNEVMGLTIWKHYALCEGDYGNFAPRSGAFMKWG